MSSHEINKVVAYITHGRRLLVFEHTAYPEAGIQVPAGTVGAGEELETAVLREAFEETDLNNLKIVSYLGEQTIEWNGRPIKRHFFHLHCRGNPPERWRHVERHPSEGPHEAIEFELYWVSWPVDIPPLAGELDTLLTAVDWDAYVL